MLKGIAALFKSGLIFNPMVLLGIILGFTAMGTMSDEQLHAFYTNYHLYLLMLLIAGLYVFFFKRTVIPNRDETDWRATSQTIIGHFLMLVISFIFSMLFIMVMSFSGEPEEDYELPEFDQVQRDLEVQKQELQQNYKSIMQAVDGPGAQVNAPAPQAGAPATK